MKKPELLAPAGDFEKAQWAFLYGADAIYLAGPSFGLRANAPNLSLLEIKKIVQIAKQNNKKVYVTVNIVLHNQEAEKLLAYLKKLEKLQIDAIIVSDLYALQLAKKHTKLKVFISTQTSIMNYQAILFLEQIGADRIILARELAKDDIKLIKEKTNVELETFIHGAMCASVSGRCVLSNYLSNRDANRGGCSQVCRWNFTLYQDNRKISDNFAFFIKDLIMASHIKELMNMAIDSFKIEGRMRSIYYIAVVVSIYRQIIDGYYLNDNYQLNKNDYLRLQKVANRHACSQFFADNDNANYHYYNNEEVSNQDFLGIVIGRKDNLIYVEQRNRFHVNDQVSIFGPNTKEKEYTIYKIYDEKGGLISAAAHPKQRVYLDINAVVEKNSIIHKLI